MRTVRVELQIINFSDRDIVLKFEAEGREFAKFFSGQNYFSNKQESDVLVRQTKTKEEFNGIFCNLVLILMKLA